MKYSKATNYALHSMVHLAMESDREAVRVEDLASRQHLSSSYLSKILTKLSKAGLITSTPGVNGGYQLLGSPDSCSFLDIIQAVEGQEAMLNCTMTHESTHHHECLIENAISEAEVKMQEVLAQKTIGDILKEVHARH
ncbi:Rrf2 family transcriptional regulator [Ruoffia tabacinasalis]|uniref:Rrf2 family transcriptional regulator n=1 Tax=Ruoffia tabacinasalis TaxID=87458 RepID=A0A5R9EMX9_9LACT|nr:Rrf2 family transcriptional regulator [Ruoffia tabacinasalis]MBG9977165.1 Rrf2 family transcriptional regulator [Ruoffia tabacinasalis]TLQ48964.1 Rrf2 family transcriptional regulator [Ruoffia tabacinasalis]